MKAKVLILVLTLTVIAACKKDQFTTTPQLKFESVNGTVFQSGQVLSFKLQATDKEGDIQDSLWIQKVSSVDCVPGGFIDSLPVPYFTPTKYVKAEVDVNFAYGQTNQQYPIISGCTGKDDSCHFRFWLKDQANHVSDTITSPTIVLLNQ